jgi:hypothetical protein
MARRLALAALAVLISQVSTPSDARAACCDAKLRASGARQNAVFRCHARAAAHGVAVEPTCIVAARFALVTSIALRRRGATSARAASIAPTPDAGSFPPARADQNTFIRPTVG